MNAFCIYSGDQDEYNVESDLLSIVGAVLCLISAFLIFKLILASYKKEKEIWLQDITKPDNDTYCITSLKTVQWTRYCLIVGLIPLLINFINFVELKWFMEINYYYDVIGLKPLSKDNCKIKLRGSGWFFFYVYVLFTNIQGFFLFGVFILQIYEWWIIINIIET